MLLSMLKENSPTLGKYTKIAKALENLEGCHVKKKIFASSKTSQLSKLGNFIDVEKADFSKNENAFTVYANKYGDLRYHEFSSKTELIYATICTFESPWQLHKHSDLIMQLYNSYNYTDDVTYESRSTCLLPNLNGSGWGASAEQIAAMALQSSDLSTVLERAAWMDRRPGELVVVTMFGGGLYPVVELLELPLHSGEFKLVLVLPNENDELTSLFSTLTNHGLAAAVRSIQPLFSAKLTLTTPIGIDIKSRLQINEEITAVSNGLAVQYGTVAVSDIGTKVKVLTCLYVPASTEMVDDEHFTLKPDKTSPTPPCYFAVVYQDTPIFYGDFNRRIVRSKYFKEVSLCL